MIRGVPFWIRIQRLFEQRGATLKRPLKAQIRRLSRTRRLLLADHLDLCCLPGLTGPELVRACWARANELVEEDLDRPADD